jgi:hypothetical protein
MSKSRDKKRLLLDEEELMPRADAWDIFYGKKPTPGVKAPEFPSPTGEPDQSIPASPLPAITYTDEPVVREKPPSPHDVQPIVANHQIVPDKSTVPEPQIESDPPIEMLVRPATAHAQPEINDRQPPKRNKAVAPIAFRARRVAKIEDDRSHIPDQTSGEKSTAPLPRRQVTAGELEFETWVKRWAPMLKRGASLRVCEVFFNLTYGSGREDCFTSNTMVMKLSGLSRSQCIRNIHHLQEIGFIEEIGEANNKEAKGTHYRFNLIPRSITS